ncbi:hypothetical protein [Dongia sp. agr-C8]
MKLSRLARLGVASAALAFAGLAARADDEPALNADEIRSQFLGHLLVGSGVAADGTRLSQAAYFSTDGKLLVIASDGNSKVSLVYTESFAIKDDALCLHDLGLMRKQRADRCYEVHGGPKDNIWSGLLVDKQNPDSRLAVHMRNRVGEKEIQERWASWESIRQEAGPIDGFGWLQDIQPNPYRFKGQRLVVRGSFVQMVGDRRGWFTWDEAGSYGDHGQFIAQGIANEMFGDPGTTAIFVGEFSDIQQMTVSGNTMFIPVMNVTAARLCEKTCGEYFENW